MWEILVDYVLPTAACVAVLVWTGAVVVTFFEGLFREKP